MKVYANLLGVWTELTEDYSINGTSPVNFVEKVLIAENGSEILKYNNEFVKILTPKNSYHIHKSCIQYTF